MQKKWIICRLADATFATKDEAIKAAKIAVSSAANKTGGDYYVMEAVAVAKLPVPEVEVQEIK